MTPLSTNEPFDQAARQLHQDSLNSVSPATLARLRDTRQGAQPRGRMRRFTGWPVATACSAVLAIAATWHFSQPLPLDIPTALPTEAALAADEALLLDDSPELYLWLGSDTALALE